MMDCKRALADSAGDPKKATDLLRERGLAKAGKREGRATSEGAIAIHIAAADPSPVAVSRAGVSPELLASEREIYRKQALASGKPEKILDKIVDGKVDKFVSEVALLEQSFVKDPDKSVGELVAAH